ncbi:Na(+)/H(+) antiporter subunit A [Rhodovibrio salinarum]|uniref:Na(+)/H(+) antiporter subunit A n=2 Tax=Rhodovibrio salinarum TaxID=1087 RepID=A0A934V1C5_9PROT|nr:Na(+)/H(+) antiporter subunit A [Rhodovibrio salinarum]
MSSAVISGFVLGALAPWLTRRLGAYVHWLLALLPAALFAYFAQFLPTIAAGNTVRVASEWVPGLDVTLSFYLDGLSLIFALLITGIGTFIVLYTGGYLHGHHHLGRFFLYLLSFMGSMLGLVLADNVITLFVFWELTSITSFLLIGFNHTEAKSRRAAMQALVVTGGGGLALLAGLLIMAAVTGTTELSEILGSPEVLTSSALYVPMTILVLLGAFSKSAQFPLHFWLPNAMEAPTPVSAYLHSSTMVKAGVYLLARLSPGLGGTELWFYALVVFGAVTMLVGGILAMRQSDLKLVLAYTTVAGLGILTMLIGLGGDYAFKAMALFLITHAFYKGGLFMVAGAIDHGTGTRDATRLGGLARPMPATFAAAVLLGLSMAGIIPFVGFIAKEVMYEATLHVGATGVVLVTVAAVFGNAFNVVAAGIVGLRPFLSSHKSTPHHPHEAPVSMLVGPVLLAALGLFCGVAFPLTAEFVAAPVMASLNGLPVGDQAAELYLWHGIKPPLILSLATLALGALGFVFWPQMRAGIAAILRAIGWGPDHGYDQTITGLERLAYAVTRVQQTGYLRHYLMATFLVAAAFILGTLIWVGGLPTDFRSPTLLLPEVIALALLIGGAIVATIVFSRVAAVAAVSVVGYAVALLFLIFSAPDLAFTQFMVETLTVVILVLVLMRVPLEVSALRTRAGRLRDGLIAIAVGTAVSLVLLTTTQGPLDLRLSEFFIENSVPVAHGHNIVNVILVDFRALDTLGEIFVVTVAGLSCFGLLRLTLSRRKAARASIQPAQRTDSGDMPGGEA